jgi:hypothetical protein
MFVIDVFETGRLRKLGVKQKTFKTEIIPVGFFILDNQAEELRMGEIGGVGLSDFVSKTFGHAEQF